MTKKSKILQILFGILGGAAIWFSLALSAEYAEMHSQQNYLVSYLFLIVFLVIFFIQRYFEKKLETRLSLFTKTYLISLCVGAGIFCLYAFALKPLFN